MRPIVNDDGSTDAALSDADMTLLRKAKGLAFLIKQCVVPASSLNVRAEAAEAELLKLLFLLERLAVLRKQKDQARKDDAASDLTEPTGFEDTPAERPDEKDMSDAAC